MNFSYFRQPFDQLFNNKTLISKFYMNFCTIIFKCEIFAFKYITLHLSTNSEMSKISRWNIHINFKDMNNFEDLQCKI